MISRSDHATPSRVTLAPVASPSYGGRGLMEREMNEFDPDWPHGHSCGDHKAQYVGAFGDYPFRHLFVIHEKHGKSAVWVRDDGVAAGYLPIINAPAPKRKLEAWVNVYADGALTTFGARSGADSDASHWGAPRIACLHVTGEEGDGM